MDYVAHIYRKYMDLDTNNIAEFADLSEEKLHNFTN